MKSQLLCVCVCAYIRTHRYRCTDTTRPGSVFWGSWSSRIVALIKLNWKRRRPGRKKERSERTRGKVAECQWCRRTLSYTNMARNERSCRWLWDPGGGSSPWRGPNGRKRNGKRKRWCGRVGYPHMRRGVRWNSVEGVGWWRRSFKA